MVEQNILLEYDMIMLVRTFHHADGVWLRQGNQYICHNGPEKFYVSPFFYCTWGSVMSSWTRGLALKKPAYWQMTEPLLKPELVAYSKGQSPNQRNIGQIKGFNL